PPRHHHYFPTRRSSDLYRELLALQQRWGDSTQRQETLAIGFLSFAIRSRRSAESAAPVVSGIVRSADANVGIDAMIPMDRLVAGDRKSTRLNSSHVAIS